LYAFLISPMSAASLILNFIMLVNFVTRSCLGDTKFGHTDGHDLLPI
jgi:hypothetical protein